MAWCPLSSSKSQELADSRAACMEINHQNSSVGFLNFRRGDSFPCPMYFFHFKLFGREQEACTKIWISIDLKKSSIFLLPNLRTKEHCHSRAELHYQCETLGDSTSLLHQTGRWYCPLWTLYRLWGFRKCRNLKIEFYTSSDLWSTYRSGHRKLPAILKYRRVKFMQHICNISVL